MKIINRNNFISIVCVSFTLIVCGKLLLEKSMGFIDKNYTENIFTCLAISFLATGILSLHYYLQRFPFLPVVIGQYILLIGVILSGLQDIFLKMHHRHIEICSFLLQFRM